LNVPFSIVIPVKNEAANLATCLESVREFDDVVLVDSGSTDSTRAIARRYGRTVIDFEWNGKFPKKRNWTLRNCKFKYPWVLFLDADESMTAEVQHELCRMLPATQHNGFWIGYRNWFLGRMLKYGDPMRKLALLRIGHGGYERIDEESWSTLDMEIHEQLVIDGSVGVIRARLDHHDRKNLSAYYSRHNEYSTWEAKRYLALEDRSKLTRRQRLKYRMMCWPLFPALYFVSSYLLKLGFLDGYAGFYFAISKMFYFYQIQAKIRELRRDSI
jgi:glycosyltransferase involved in cell wall biosynthesis